MGVYVLDGEKPLFVEASEISEASTKLGGALMLTSQGTFVAFISDDLARDEKWREKPAPTGTRLFEFIPEPSFNLWFTDKKIIIRKIQLLSVL